MLKTTIRTFAEMVKDIEKNGFQKDSLEDLKYFSVKLQEALVKSQRMSEFRKEREQLLAKALLNNLPVELLEDRELLTKKGVCRIPNILRTLRELGWIK